MQPIMLLKTILKERIRGCRPKSLEEKRLNSIRLMMSIERLILFVGKSIAILKKVVAMEILPFYIG